MIEAFIKSFLDGQHNRFNAKLWKIVAKLGNPDAADLRVRGKCITDHQDPQGIQEMTSTGYAPVIGWKSDSRSALQIFARGLISSAETPSSSKSRWRGHIPGCDHVPT